MVDREARGEEGQASVSPLPFPSVPTSSCQGNPRPQGRGPPTPRPRWIPSSTPEPASGTSPATLRRPWPPPPRPGLAAQAAQPRPPPPTQTRSPVGLRQRLPVRPPPPRLLLHFRVRRVGGRRMGTRGGATTGGGAASGRPRPTLQRLSTCVRRLAGAPGLCLYDQGAPSCRMAQDGDLEWRKNQKRKRMTGAHRMGGGPRREAVVAKSKGPEEETFLSASRILADLLSLLPLLVLMATVWRLMVIAFRTYLERKTFMFLYLLIRTW